MTSGSLFSRLCADIDAKLADLPQLGSGGGLAALAANCRGPVAMQALDDLHAYAARDAAAGGDPAYVYESYASFQAVFGYRLAHQLVRLAATAGHPDRQPSHPLRSAARRLSEQTKVRTGVEIHPAAVIGRRFVIDHGFGTVIGEQTILGDDCYLLQGVVLGGPSIGHSADYGAARRHPRIGHRVEIGGGVAVFGPVHIGDDCRLEAGVRVTFDVPDGARIRLVSVAQVCVLRGAAEVRSISSTPQGIRVTGDGLAGLRPALLNEDRSVASFLPVTEADESSIDCGPPTERPGRLQLLGLFEEADLTCYVGGASVVREL